MDKVLLNGSSIITANGLNRIIESMTRRSPAISRNAGMAIERMSAMNYRNVGLKRDL